MSKSHYWFWGAGIIYAAMAFLVFYGLHFLPLLHLPSFFDELAEFINVAVNVNFYGAWALLTSVLSPFIPAVELSAVPEDTRLLWTLAWQSGLFFLFGLIVGRTLNQEGVDPDDALTGGQCLWRLFEWLVLAFIITSAIHGIAWLVIMRIY